MEDAVQGEMDAHGSMGDLTGVSGKGQHKRSKNKSKVWEKVAWFTRRSRSRDPEGAAVPDIEIEGLPPDHMEYDLSPSASSCEPLPLDGRVWSDSSSSSEGEFFDFSQEGVRVKRSRLYPNSEVVEQNCLKPSVARALFLQMEATNYRNGKSPPKYAWPKKKKRLCTMPRSDSFHDGMADLLHCPVEEEPLNRTLSMPNEITKSSCHCAACCSCTPAQRLMGACPAHPRLSFSTTSLDTGLFLSNSHSQSCSREPSHALPDQPVESTEGKNPTNNCDNESVSLVTDTNQYKSNSLPNYYSNSLHEKSKLRGTAGQLLRCHLPTVCDNCAQTTGGTSTCDCKTATTVSPPDSVHSKQPQTTSVTHCTLPSVKDRFGPDEFQEKLQTMKEWFSQFNHEQKNIMIKDLLGHCELPQFHLLSLEMAPRLHEGCPQNCEDLLTWLPQGIAQHILLLLDPLSLCQASMVCKTWYQLTTEPSLWRRFCCQPKWRLSRAGEQKQLINHIMPNSNIHWKQVFAERYKLRNNWLKGRCNVRTFEGHTQGISCVQFDDTRIVSGSSDKTIKVWNIRTNTPWSVQTLVGHSGTVRCLHLEGNRLVSGSTDGTIKVWDLSTQQSWSSIACKVTMTGHQDTVRCLQVDDEKVISGSYDKTLKVWDIRSGLCRMTLRGHGAAVLCVQFDDDKIVSGSCDKFIKVWTFEGQCVMTLEGHHDAVTCLQFDNTRIISGSLDCNLKFWDLHSGQCLNTIDWKASEGHTGVVRCLQADSWRVVSASDDRTLKVWSLETGQRLVTLRNHTDGVTCLQFNDSIIVSGSYDKTVKLWDFSCC